jgi:hypothetical protein
LNIRKYGDFSQWFPDIRMTIKIDDFF